MLFSRSEGREVEPPCDTLFKGFGNLYSYLFLRSMQMSSLSGLIRVKLNLFGSKACFKPCIALQKERQPFMCYT